MDYVGVGQARLPPQRLLGNAPIFPLTSAQSVSGRALPRVRWPKY